MIKKLLLFLFISIAFSSCSNNTKQVPTAIKGVLDLRKWDFEEDGIVKLDGEWEFYWHQFLMSNDFDTVEFKNYIFVPGTWKGHTWDSNTILPYDGFVSYKLKLLLDKQFKDLAFKIPNCGTAYRLFINDSLYGGNGIAGISKESSKPQFLPLIFPNKNISDTITLVFHISNYHYWKGGIWLSINFGKESQVRESEKINTIIESFISGTFIIVFIYFLMLFIFLKKDKILIVWSIMCLSIVPRILATGELILVSLFKDINWEFLIRFELIPFFGGILLLCLYIFYLFNNIFSKKVLWIISIYSFSIVFLSLFTDAVFYSNIVPVNQIAGIIFWFYVQWVSIKAVRKNQEGSILILISVTIYFIAMLNAILFYTNIINTFDSAGYGLILFTLIQSMFISQRFSRAINKIENFANELKITVNERTKELRAEKEKSDKLLLNVLPEQIANRLKSGETQIADHFEEASVIFIDIVDFTKMSAKSSPQKMVNMLNEIFSIFDKISAKYGLEKIKTIGDCYMAAAGIPVPRKDHAQAIALMALEVMETMKGYSYSSDDFKSSDELYLINFRIGLDCGPIEQEL